MKKRQRIIMSDRQRGQARSNGKPVLKNTTPPPKKARQVEPTVDTFPYYIVGGILTVGMFVNFMMWCFIVLGNR